MTVDDRAFAALCYLVLMDHHGRGYGYTHPSYAKENLAMLSMEPRDAFAVLDYQNQERVTSHIKQWGFKMPAVLSRIEA